MLVGADFSELECQKIKIKNNDKALENQYAELLKAADEILPLPADSVVQGDLPPTGDIHDFYMLGRYSWPNPETPDGMPYKRVDCKVNPDSVGPRYDLARMYEMIRRVNLLTRAGFYSQDEKYSAKAAEFLRVWFIDSKTKMNPNFNCASSLPGVVDGMPAGIIYGDRFPELIDHIKLLALSKSWKSADDTVMKQWFKDYVKWLLESEFGKKEGQSKNNHGTWYAVQIASASIYTGEIEYAKSMLKRGQMLIDSQTAKNGSFPIEVKREWGFSYSIYNLRALVALALCAQKLDEDLWNFKTTDGRGLSLAFEYLSPYLSYEKKWEGGSERPDEDSYKLALPMMIKAAKKYDAPEIKKAVLKLQQNYPNELMLSWF